MAILLAIISMTIPVLGFCLTLVYFQQYKHVLISALLCGLAASGAMYGYVPDIGNDIFRHMENMTLYEEIPLWDAFDLMKTDISHISTVYTWDIWLWIVAQCDNPMILQASGAFVGFSIISYMIFLQSKRYDSFMGQWLPIYFISLFSFPPLEIAIGIRSACAFLLCVMGVYLYSIRQIHHMFLFILFLIAIFLHHAAILFAILWLILPAFRIYQKSIALIIVLLLLAFNNFQAYLTFFSGGSIFSDLMGSTMYSAAAYQEGGFNDSFHALASMALRWGYSALLLFTIWYSFIREQKNIHIEDANLQLFSYMLIIFIVATAFLFIIGNNGLRYLGAIDILACLLLFRILSIDNKSMWFRKGKLGLSQAILLSGAMMQLSLYLYDMSWGTASLKSFFISLITGYFSSIF